MMQRVIAYVDGYNLYHGLRAKGWKRFYWLNVPVLIGHLLRPNQELVATKYFTTIIKRPEDKRRRQTTYLEALQTLPNVRFFYGQFLEDTITCRRCRHTYVTHHEKMTDVNISVELMSDAFQDRFDLALLLSADSDLAGSVSTVRRLFNRKRVIVVFPPKRSSYALQTVANAALHIGHNELSKSLLPDKLYKPDGIELRRPTQWR